MFCQLFGKYLLEQRAINEFDYRTLIDEQMSVRYGSEPSQWLRA